MTDGGFRSLLAERFAFAGVTPPEQLVEQLRVYYDLLATWNRKINLTGMNLAQPTEEALDRLLVEPVVAARYSAVEAPRIIDIGSGGGSPAIPFALALPGSYLRMVESRSRKSVFLKEALRAVNLRGDVVTTRFEELSGVCAAAYDILTVRAVRVEPADLESLRNLVRPMGQILLFRRRAAVDFDVPDSLAVVDSHPLVPSLSSHLVVLRKLS